MGIKNIKAYRRRRKVLVYGLVILIGTILFYRSGSSTEHHILSVTMIPMLLGVSCFVVDGATMNLKEVWREEFDDKNVLTLVKKLWNGY